MSTMRHPHMYTIQSWLVASACIVAPSRLADPALHGVCLLWCACVQGSLCDLPGTGKCQSGNGLSPTSETALWTIGITNIAENSNRVQEVTCLTTSVPKPQIRTISTA